MNRSSSELKKLARTTLQGKYGTFIGTFIIFELIFIATSFIIAFVSPVSISRIGILIQLGMHLAMSIILTVFQAGFTHQALNATRQKAIGVGNLFYAFGHHPDRFIVVTLLQSLIALVCFIPVIAFTIYSYLTLNIDIFSSFFIYLLLLFVGAVLSFIISLGFSLSFYLILDNPDMGAIDSIRISFKLMKGNKWRIFYLSLSFIGMSILGVLSFGIGMLWIAPYINVTSAFFYLDVIGELDVAAAPLVEPTITFVEPVVVPTEPIATPVEPVVNSTEPIATPVEPIVNSTEPIATESTDTPVDNTQE